MRLFVSLLAVTACVVGSRAMEPIGGSDSGVVVAGVRAQAPEAVLAWRFVGTKSLAGNTNGSQARAILEQPASQWVVRNTLDKLARTPGAWLAVPGATNPPAAALLRPWIEALLEVESQGELTRGPNGASAVVAALRLSADQSGALRAKWAAWAEAVGGTAPTEVQAGNLTVRETKLGTSLAWSRLAQAGDWTVIGLGKGSDQPFASLTSRLGGSAGMESWLTVRASGTNLAHWVGWAPSGTWPEMEFQLTGRGAILRTTARFTYPQPLDLKIEPWRIPTHTIGDPVVNFTVAQGIRSWLDQRAWWKALGFPTTPNQATAWTVAEIPFASYITWEMPEVTNTLRQLGPRVPGFLAQFAPKIQFGDVVFQTNTTRVAWVGLPIAEPFISPAAEKDPDFAVAGLFPLLKARRPVPPELLSQVTGRTNLVYYDWELTAQRINGWRHVKNLYWMLAGYHPPPTNHTGESWLFDTNVVDRLGNTGTEVTVASPRELAGLRNSALGLTGLELVALARWLDDPAFPRLSEPPMTPFSLRRLRQREGASTAPAATPERSTPAPSAPPQPTP